MRLPAGIIEYKAFSGRPDGKAIGGYSSNGKIEKFMGRKPREG